jgi:hypothetical protein
VERRAQSSWVVAGPAHAPRREQIGFEDPHAQSGERSAIARNGVRSPGGVGRDHPLRQRPGMHQRCVDHRAEVPLDCAHVIRGVVAVGLTGLREKVDDQHAPAPASGEGFSHAFAEEAGDHAGVEAAGTEYHQVRIRHCLEGGRGGPHRPLQAQSGHPTARDCDGRFAANDPAVGELGYHVDALGGRRQDAAVGSEQPGRSLHRGAEVAEALGERSENEVAHGMAAQTAIAGETMLEDPGERVLSRRERDQAVADVARAGKPVLTAKLARAAAVVGGGHDRRDLHGQVLGTRESAEDGGQSSPAAHGGHAEWSADLPERLEGLRERQFPNFAVVSRHHASLPSGGTGSVRQQRLAGGIFLSRARPATG